MAYYYDPNTSCHIVTPPDPANYLGGFVAEQLARACVVTKVYMPNSNQPPTKGTSMTVADVMEVTKTRVKAGSSPPVLELDPTNTTSGRDIYGNSPDFWTVRIVMVSAYQNYGGFFVIGGNTIIICYAAIEASYPNASADTINTAIQQILLHEVGHVLMDRDHAANGLMKASHTSNERLMKENQEFLLDQIKKIQEYSRARN